MFICLEQTFSNYRDHASLRTATKSPLLRQPAHGALVVVFAEYDFVAHYKPGSTNIITTALSLRLDYDLRDDNPVLLRCTQSMMTVSLVQLSGGHCLG